MELTQEAIHSLKSREGLRARNRLAFELEKSQATIDRWINSNDEMLTTASALRIISEETGIKQKDLLTESAIQK